jgi:methylmalonyl-CoA mutase
VQTKIQFETTIFLRKMTSRSPDSKKKHLFKATTKKDWEGASQLEWNASAPIAGKHSSHDAVYFDASDLPIHRRSQLLEATTGYNGVRSWSNMPRILVNDDQRANRIALESLNSGADGILFELASDCSPEKLLNDIQLPFCDVVFFANAGQNIFFKKLFSLLGTKKTELDLIKGGIFWKGPSHQQTVEQFSMMKMFHADGILENEIKNSPADEIAFLLAKAVTQINATVDSTNDLSAALNSIAFSIEINTAFFPAIAKLKTLRMLWDQITRSYEPEYSSPAFIHAISNVWNSPEYEPHGNLLKSTTAGMSAILGGCDALTIAPDNRVDSMTERIARNVSLILREESHFSKVADPTAGAYALENQIDRLAQETWLKFQQLIG